LATQAKLSPCDNPPLAGKKKRGEGKRGREKGKGKEEKRREGGERKGREWTPKNLVK